MTDMKENRKTLHSYEMLIASTEWNIKQFQHKISEQQHYLDVLKNKRDELLKALDLTEFDIIEEDYPL